jgi:hypothetical protein
MKTLGDVQTFLSNIPNIKYGGCGISALAMYRWLKKNNKLKKSVKFLFLHSYDGYLYRNNKKYVEQKIGSPTACSHVGLFYNNRTIDCDGFINTRNYKYKVKTSDENVMVMAINNLGDWNTDFNRKHIKKIEKKLEIDMSDVISSRKLFKPNIF